MFFCLEHQFLDKLLAGICGSHRHRFRRGVRPAVVGADFEREKRFRADHRTASEIRDLHRVERHVEHAVAFVAARIYRFFREIGIVDDLVDFECLRGQRILAVSCDGEQNLCRVEDRHIAEITVIYQIVAGELRQQSCRSQADCVIVHRPDVAGREIRCDNRIGLIKPCEDVLFRIVLPVPLQYGVTRFHLLVIGYQVGTQRIVFRCAANGEHDRKECGQRQLARRMTGFIREVHHRIACNCRKSPLRRATGIRERVSRSRVPFRASGHRPAPSRSPHRRHSS